MGMKLDQNLNYLQNIILRFSNLVFAFKDFLFVVSPKLSPVLQFPRTYFGYQNVFAAHSKQFTKG